MPEILYVEPKYNIAHHRFVSGRLGFDKFVGTFISEQAAKLECDALRKAYFPHSETMGKAIFTVEFENENGDFEKIY